MEAELDASLGYEKNQKAIWIEMVIDFKQQTAVVTGGRRNRYCLREKFTEIRVNAVAPGGVKTKAMEAMQFPDNMLEPIPLRRLSEP